MIVSLTAADIIIMLAGNSDILIKQLSVYRMLQSLGFDV